MFWVLMTNTDFTIIPQEEIRFGAGNLKIIKLRATAKPTRQRMA